MERARVMVSPETEQENFQAPRLPILTTKLQHNSHESFSYTHSPEKATPPHYTTSVSVPFRWEEEPGKPRQCAPPSTPVPKGLELPPRLSILEATATTPKNRQTSPTTVLEGPHSYQQKSRFQSSSFRNINREIWHGSWRKGGSSSTTTSIASSPERDGDQFGPVVVLGKGGGVWSPLVRGMKKPCRGCSGGHHREVYTSGRHSFTGSHVFSSLVDRDTDRDSSNANDGAKDSKKNMKIKRITRSGSLPSLSKSCRSPNLWANIYGGLKHALVPFRNKIFKKDRFTI